MQGYSVLLAYVCECVRVSVCVCVCVCVWRGRCNLVYVGEVLNWKPKCVGRGGGVKFKSQASWSNYQTRIPVTRSEDDITLL